MRRKFLYIDDIRNPEGIFDIARTSNEAIEYMKTNGCPSYISWDHDLGGSDTSMVVVNWMIETDLDNNGFIPCDFSFFVHSANPVGAANIESKLNNYLNFRKTS